MNGPLLGYGRSWKYWNVARIFPRGSTPIRLVVEPAEALIIAVIAIAEFWRYSRNIDWVAVI